MNDARLTIGDFERGDDASAWRAFTDRVMGGISTGDAVVVTVRDRRALRLTGHVSLERNGGFVQVARSLGREGAPLDARAFDAIVVRASATPGSYFVHLRTDAARAPWEHYAAPLPVTGDWSDVRVPWDAFVPKSLRAPLDVGRLTRIGIVAAGAAFDADIAIASISFVT